jgi:phage baseplate assembly protein W
MADDFLGSGLKFPLEIDRQTGAFMSASGEEKIRAAVLTILSTTLGERVMRPDFGSELHNQVFASLNAATLGALAFSVRKALIAWEPRIKVQDVQVSDVQAAEGVVSISIDYTVRATDTRFNLVYPFHLQGLSS